MLWLCRKTDWLKLLQLPNVSWWQFLFAVACVVVVIWSILRLIARVNEDVDPAEADREMLERLNDLRRQGDLSEDEFRSIKSQIMGRLSTTWKVTPKTGLPAKTADHVSEALKSDTNSENFSPADSETNDHRPSTLNSIQSEFFASPTNVPDPPQDTTHLPKGLMPLESENSQGHTEAGPENELKE